jgi:hypothetical protein
MERITLEITRRANARSVTVRAVWQPFEGQEFWSSTRNVRLDREMPELTALDCQEVMNAARQAVNRAEAELPF